MFSRLERTDSFVRDYLRLPLQIQRRTEKAIELLARGLQHPSLHVKRVQGTKSIWEARVTRQYRLTFEVGPGNLLRLRRVGTHDILKTP
jgi:mRNA-degrading endonuclease YafQ of YafQ-DinJ toxin-antitoxin module